MKITLKTEKHCEAAVHLIRMYLLDKLSIKVVSVEFAEAYDIEPEHLRGTEKFDPSLYPLFERLLGYGRRYQKRLHLARCAYEQYLDSVDHTNLETMYKTVTGALKLISLKLYDFNPIDVFLCWVIEDIRTLQLKLERCLEGEFYGVILEGKEVTILEKAIVAAKKREENDE